MFRRATFLRETHPYPSLLRYCLSKVVSASASKHRAGVRATVPAVQVRRECSFGAAGVPWDLMDGLSNSDSASSRPDPRSRSPMCAQKTLKRGFAPPALSNLSKPNLSCVLGGPNAPAVESSKILNHADCQRRGGTSLRAPRRRAPGGGAGSAGGAAGEPVANPPKNTPRESRRQAPAATPALPAAPPGGLPRIIQHFLA